MKRIIKYFLICILFLPFTVNAAHFDDSKFYNESRRLLGAIRTFFPISSEYIEDDNILREFIGGSIYEK